MKKLLIAVACGILLASCANTATKEETVQELPTPEVQSRLNDISWVLGEWQLETPDGVLLEKWQQETDTSFIGEGSLTSKKGEVLFSEKLRLEQRAGVLYYIPTIASQNDGKPVVFAEKSFAGSEVVFENPEHDFPQRIIYQKRSDSMLYARIEGKRNGKDAKEEYSYTKKAQ